jgi:hypothetical protein
VCVIVSQWRDRYVHMRILLDSIFNMPPGIHTPVGNSDIVTQGCLHNTWCTPLRKVDGLSSVDFKRERDDGKWWL